MNSAEHRKVSDTIDSRLTRLWAVYGRIKGEAFNLSVLAYLHYVASAVPNAAYIALTVTDQGGDTMTFSGIGVEEQLYLAWEREVGFEPQDLACTVIEDAGGGHRYVEIEYDHPAIDVWLNEDRDPYLTEDQLAEYAMALEEYQLVGEPWFEQIGNRHSGMGRIWVASALLALNSVYEGFVGDALDPMPDPNDKVALAAWLARATAPEEN